MRQQWRSQEFSIGGWGGRGLWADPPAARGLWGAKGEAPSRWRS